MNDERVKLKIKIKSLMCEAHIIRREESKLSGMRKWDLQHHRKTVVRTEARRALIAYQWIRGKDPRVHFHSDPAVHMGTDWEPVKRLVERYGNKEGIAELEKLFETGKAKAA